MKRQTRVIAFDDGRFSSRSGQVPVVGIVARLPSYVEAAVISACEIDGKDATERVIETVASSRLKEQIRAIMIDGIAFGGFNVIDLEEVKRKTGVPLISVTRHMPDLEAIRDALVKHFDDWERRFSTIKQYTPYRLETPRWKLYVSSAGMSKKETLELVDASIVRGNYPEPLRLAHIFAGAVSTGESTGRA
ncbi:MAG: DUF99 family protein [Methanomassiliicoccales archaeon]